MGVLDRGLPAFSPDDGLSGIRRSLGGQKDAGVDTHLDRTHRHTGSSGSDAGLEREYAYPQMGGMGPNRHRSYALSVPSGFDVILQRNIQPNPVKQH